MKTIAPSTPRQVTRLHYLDWLRVFAILAVFIFHSTRLFDTDDWSIKNPTNYLFVDVWRDFATSWGMPLILLISGASLFYAIGKTTPGRFIKGILARLFLPLVIGIFTHIALQVYLENLNKNNFKGSFFEFYPHYFEGMYGFGGNFAWMGLHLWYLEALFIFSLLLLPLFWWLRKRTTGQRTLESVGNFLSKPATVFLFALPVILLIAVLDPETWGNREMGGWSVFIYPCFLMSGFVIISSERLQTHIQCMRWSSLGLGLALSAAYLFLEFQTSYSLPLLVKKSDDLLLSLSAWCWLLAVFGFGMKHLNLSTPLLKYANEAVLPFYILHQTAIVCLGYFVVQWTIPDWLKFVLVLSASFLVSMGVYHFLVRPFNLLRFLFGMKPLARLPGSQPVDAKFIEAA
jgi:glucan biosynthesis protein C